MPLTPTPLYCSNGDCQQLKARKSYSPQRQKSSPTPMCLELNGTSTGLWVHGARAARAIPRNLDAPPARHH